MPSAPALTAASCAALLEKQRYDPSILPQLEAYVDAQCASKSYDCDANLATLKLYQFHPDLLKPPVVCKILVKALMQLPQTDYLCCTYLLPERVLDEAPVDTITAVAALLETGCFREFWAAVEPLRKDLLSATPGFDDAVREFILGTFEITYQSVPASHLKASLGASDADFAALVKKRGWTVTGDLVKIALNDDNTAKPKRVDANDTMNLQQMTKILASISSSS
jgi:translation initiation factor 3 subunit K